MYDLNDTIVAISSPPFGARVIVRISGADTIRICEQIFSPPVASIVHRPSSLAPCLIAGSITIDNELEIDAHLYLFLAPNSYTGDDVAELHLFANDAVTEALINTILKTEKSVGQPTPPKRLRRPEAPPYSSVDDGRLMMDAGRFVPPDPSARFRGGEPAPAAAGVPRHIRMAGPGEFTARAYLNGKIDLAQAEAVNEIVVSSNAYQLAAAEKLLSGRLGQISNKVCSEIMDCLSLIEAGLDFSGEDIEFITRQQAVERLIAIMDQLRKLLSASSYESIIDLPAVGIAGAPNAGKSSLLNKLLGQERSIISDQRKTTRDVLTGLLTLAHCKCVLFDCAGLTRYSIPDSRFSILDELAQRAAVESLQNASVVIFCVDVSKNNWSEDIAIRKLITPKVLVSVATKSDLVSQEVLENRVASLNKLFGADFLAISVKTDVGLEQLQETIDRKIIELATCLSRMSDEGRGMRDESSIPSTPLRTGIHHPSSIILTARHRQAVNETIEGISQAITTLTCGEWKPHTLVCGVDQTGVPPAWEVTAMMLRDAYQIISNIDSEHIDEKILEKIFSRFCIGK